MSYTVLHIYIKNCEPILSVLDTLSLPHFRTWGESSTWWGL